MTCPKESLAGEEGFEPSNAGIKIRCLDQLGDSPAGCSNGFASERGANNTGAGIGNPAPLVNFCEWVLGQAVGYPAFHAGGQLGEQGGSLVALSEAGKNAGPGAGHHGLRGMLLEPDKVFGHSVNHPSGIIMCSAPIFLIFRDEVVADFGGSLGLLRGRLSVDRRLQIVL